MCTLKLIYLVLFDLCRNPDLQCDFVERNWFFCCVCLLRMLPNTKKMIFLWVEKCFVIKQKMNKIFFNEMLRCIVVAWVSSRRRDVDDVSYDFVDFMDHSVVNMVRWMLWIREQTWKHGTSIVVRSSIFDFFYSDRWSAGNDLSMWKHKKYNRFPWISSPRPTKLQGHWTRTRCNKQGKGAVNHIDYRHRQGLGFFLRKRNVVRTGPCSPNCHFGHSISLQTWTSASLANLLQ